MTKEYIGYLRGDYNILFKAEKCTIALAIKHFSNAEEIVIVMPENPSYFFVVPY